MKKGKETIGANEVFGNAAQLANVITKWIGDRPECHKMGMTVIGYAVELILGSATEHQGEEFDRMSAEFRNFLGVAHEDVKKAAEIIKQSNIPQA